MRFSILRPASTASLTAVVSVLLLSACTDGTHRARTTSAAAASTPTTSTSRGATTSTPTPTPNRTGPLTTGPNVRPGEKPPSAPDGVRTHDSAGALSAATFFLQALDWGAATTDGFLLDQISSSKCASCQASIASLERLRSNGSHVSGGRIRIRSLRVVHGQFTTQADQTIEAVVDEDAIQTIDNAGHTRTTTPARLSDRSLIFVSWMANEWEVIDWGAPS